MYSSPVVRLHLSHFQTQDIVRKSLLSDTIFCSRYPDFVLSFSLTTQPCLSLVTTTIKLGVWPKSNGQTSVGKRTEAGTGWPARQDLSLITKSYAIWRHGTTLTRDMTARKGVADYIFFPVKPAAHTRPSTPVFVLETKADTEVDYVMFPPIHPLLIILCTLCWDEREFWGVCYIISHDA